MDNTDYTFMKSGFNMLQPPDDDEFAKNATSVIVAYAEQAMRTAAKYISHGERNVITPEDIKRAMMLEMFLFNKRPNLLEKAEEIKRELYEEESDDDEMEDLIIDSDEEEVVEFSKNTCECPLCTCINNIYARWENFTPETQFEILFKKHIDRI